MSGKKFLRTFLSVAAAAAIPVLVACASYEYASYEPPAEQVEVYGVAPGPDFVWIGGHHVWHSGAYHWEKGRWEKPPHAGARWERGRWEHTSRGWRYTDGRWR